MRKEFSKHITKLALENEKIVFLTGDLGFMAFETLKESIGKRFINIGVSEQNMISMAASLAYEGFIPLCYSIAPFAVFRPSEQIRLDVCIHNLNVKIIGNGGGYGYGIMGATHHAIEDIAMLSSFQNMKCFVPWCNEDVFNTIDAMFAYNGPSYLRLGYGDKPATTSLPLFSPIRHLTQGEKITIVAMGPIVINVLKAIEIFPSSLADVFIVSEIPVFEISEELKQSIKKTNKLIVIEEHVSRGGIGENLATLLLKDKCQCSFSHLYANGYKNGLYGSQAYHQQVNGLDANSIITEINTLLNE
ncbi:MAG: transketolase family protein [Bacteroidales bacterium]